MTAPAPTAVALAPTAPGQIQSANEMADALKAVQAAIAPDLNPAELRLFAMVAYRSGLDPFARQIHAIKRQGKVTFQTGIDGFRSSAERTGTYDGQDEPEFGPVCSCNEAPKPHPEWARVTVYRIRNGERKPQAATAYWHEFKPAPGPNGNQDHMWKKMPRNQLAKCAEALSFRKAFPYVLADIYSPEEMAQAGPVVLEHRPTAREAVAARRAELEADVDGSAAADPDVSGTATDAGAEDVVEGQVVDVDDAAWSGEAAAEIPAELTYVAFAARRQERGITPADVATAAKELFPDAKGLKELTDAQRGALWQALESAPASQA